MAEKKEPQADSDSELVQVIVEMRVPADSNVEAMRSVASQSAMPGFQLDTSYEPVPMQAPADPQVAAEVSAAREQVVAVRGTIEKGKIAKLKKQDNVLNVIEDKELFAPFGHLAPAAAPEDSVSLVASSAFGTCPIPPCDCEPRTAKGNIRDVARRLGVDKIWADGVKGQGVVVGVVDGGLSAKGRVGGGKIANVIGGWPTDSWGKKAEWGEHGNMSATDALGMAPEAKLYDIRIASGGITATLSAALSGYQWAINQHRANGTPHILTNSWGLYQKAWDPDAATDPNHIFTRKVVEAINQGILVLFAAGNCGEACPAGRCGRDNGPGKSIWGANGHPMVMTVGAANTEGQLVGYSSQGPAALDANKPDFCGISHFKGYFQSDTGTSAACPVAAGVVALLKQKQRTLSQVQAKDLLRRHAKDLGGQGWDPHSGTGIIQAKATYDGLMPQDRCHRLRHQAATALARYRRTGQRRHLCAHYRFAAIYFRCRYIATRNRRYLCLYYRYRGLYYRCRHAMTRRRSYLCAFYRDFYLYYRCLHGETGHEHHRARAGSYKAQYRRCAAVA